MKKILMAIAISAALSACSKPAPEAETAAQLPADPATAQPVPTDAAATAAADGTAPAAASGGDASIKMVRLSCPGGISLQAADGGPVLINGASATVKVTSPTYYEAADTASGVTVSVMTNPDGTQSASYTGKGGANGVCSIEGAAPAQGKIALLNATCPGGIELHADENGPVYINGAKASLSVSNPNYYEAKDAKSGVTVSVSTDANGAATVSYTGKGGANGICEVKG